MGEIRIQLKDTASTASASAAASGTLSRFAGALYVDGVRTDASALRTIDPNRIVSVNVFKHEAAPALYPNDPAAANGVIRIVTRAPVTR